MKIHWNENDHLQGFVELNTQWIEKYFQLEDIDIDLFKDPSIIYRNGGYILSISDRGNVVGVCALIKKNDETYELARMAVDEFEHGKGIGKLMLNELLKKSKAIGVKKITIVSNTILEAAVGLYQTYGFETVYSGPHPVYSRGNIVLEKFI